MPMRLFFATAALAACSALNLPAQILENYSAAPGLTILDGDPVGLVSTINVPFSSIAQITSISVALQIGGGYNGDYYAYLVHYLPDGSPAGFVTLLNRVGVTAGDPLGYGDAGLDITFASLAPDIHLYQAVTNPGGAALTGTWSPDGRTADPFLVTDASPRLSSLASFDGSAAVGQWTLFIADVAGGDIGTFVSWGLTIQGVPEPGTAAIGALALALAVGAHSRRGRAAGTRPQT